MDGFRWLVPKMGYRWLTGNPGATKCGDESRGMPRLIPILLDYREYAPFEKPGLFRTFADLESTPDAVLGFANKYGHLGDDPLYPEDLVHPHDMRLEQDEYDLQSYSEKEKQQPRPEWKWEQRFLYSLPEPFFRWSYAIGRMRKCVVRWDRCRAGNADEKEVEELVDEVNEQMNLERVEILLRRPKPKLNFFRLESFPGDLLAAMWIQLAQAIAADKELCQCPGCGEWFERSSKQFRTSRIYCQDSCKSQAYRDRKVQAIHMIQAGKTIAEAAEVLDTTSSNVERWLSQSKRGLS